jgi:peptidyl-tRNA hydrolase
MLWVGKDVKCPVSAKNDLYAPRYFFTVQVAHDFSTCRTMFLRSFVGNHAQVDERTISWKAMEQTLCVYRVVHQTDRHCTILQINEKARHRRTDQQYILACVRTL